MVDRVLIKRDEVDGGWIASCPELPGCMSQGETETEALRNLADAASEILAAIVELVEGSHTTFQAGARVVEYLGVGGPRLGVRGPSTARVATSAHRS